MVRQIWVGLKIDREDLGMKKDLLNKTASKEKHLVEKALNLVILSFAFLGQVGHTDDDLGGIVSEAFVDTVTSDDLIQEIEQLPALITDTLADTIASDDLIQEIEQLPVARKEAALELQKVMGSLSTGERYVEGIVTGFSEGLTQTLQEQALAKGAELNPWVSQLFIEEIETIMSEYFMRVGLSDSIALATWGRNFSTDELREITKFHKTPTGQKFNEYASDMASHVKPALAVQGYYIKRAGPIMAEAIQDSMTKYPNLFQ